MSNEKIIDLADLQAQTEELVTAIDAKDAATIGSAEDYADSCLLEAKDYADDQDASVLQDAKDYADSAASAAGSSAAASSVPLTQKGAPGGVAELDANGLVPSAQLPSFVDDVLEYQDVNAFPATGETGKIYVSLADNKTYRWSGSAYTEISASLALGTTDSTAGRGDWTYAGYQHALAKGSQFASNLYKITTNAEGHVVAATPVTKQDIVDLGIPGGDTTYDDATQTTHGLMSATDKAKLDGIETNANNYTLPTMSPTTKGGAKQGDGLSVENDTLNLGPLVKHSTGATDGSAIFGVQGEGWAEQATTTGKNLLDYTTFVQGSIDGQGVDTNTDIRLRSPLVGVNPQATYAISVNGSVGSSLMRVYEVNEYDASKSWLRSISANATNYVYHPNSDAQYVKILLRVGNNSVITVNDIVWFQLEAGSTATSYEPYTGGVAAPNPDYPQPIMVARGRNLLPNDASRLDAYISGGAIHTDSVFRIVYVPCQPNTTYTVSRMRVRADDERFQLAFTSEVPANNVSVSNASALINWSGPVGEMMTLTSTSASDSKYAVIWLGWYNTYDELIGANAQLEQGTTPTPYVPYGHVGLEVEATPTLYKSGYAINASGIESENANFDIYSVGVTRGKYTVSLTLNDNRTTRIHGYKQDGTWYAQLGVIDPTYVYNGTLSVDISVPNVVTELRIQKARTYTNLKVGSVTPVPIPATGLASLPNGTKDTLVIDSAGHVGGVQATSEAVYNGTENWTYESWSGDANFYSPAPSDCKPASAMTSQNAYVSHAMGVSDLSSKRDKFAISTRDNPGLNLVFGDTLGVSTAAAFKTWLASNNVTLRYQLLTPATWDGGYIDLPDLPEGATVTIPELDNVGVDYWISGIPEVTEYGQAMQARLQGEIDEAEQQVVDLAEMLGEMIKLSSVNTIEFIKSGDSSKIRFKQDDSNYKEVSFKSDGISYTGRSSSGLLLYWDIPAS